MIDFSKIPPSNLTEEWLLNKISDSSIFRLYHGDFKIGKIYPSIFRKDNNPSCGFFIHKGTGALLYNDIAKGEKLNCIQFVMKLHGLKYYDAIRKIATDFGLIEGEKPIVTKEWLLESNELEKDVKNETLIQFIPKPFTKEDLQYWAQYEITEQELTQENIFSVKELYLNKRHLPNFNNELRFAYPISLNGETKVKIYSPHSKKMKWLSSIPNDWCFGLNRLQFKSDTIFITKSRKDELVLKKIFTDVISVQNESEQSLPEHVMQFLNENYKHKIIVFDADPPGINACKKFNDKGFGYFNTPRTDYEKYSITDPSDYVKAFSLDLLKEEFKKKNLL